MTYGKTPEFRWLEERLHPLNFRLILLTRSAESFASAREERLKVSSNPAQYDDLGLFVREQQVMKELVDKTLLPVLHVDISDNDIDPAVGEIYDRMETSGGLWMED